jgi:hypothetical protein
MDIKIFIFLPENEDDIVALADNLEEFKKFQQDFITLLDEVKVNTIFTLVYDEKNFESFFNEYVKWDNGTHLDNFRNVVQIKMGRKSESISIEKIKDKDCHYLMWNLDQFTPSYANDLLSFIAEQVWNFSEQKHLLVNFRNSIKADRKSIIILKDAKHISDLPKIAHIPFVIDKLELKLWLETFQENTPFSLLDRNRFIRTNRPPQQGKPVFQEIKTGDYWYLDNFHKQYEAQRHYEVFDKHGEHKGTANLLGNFDGNGKKDGRTLDLA